MKDAFHKKLIILDSTYRSAEARFRTIMKIIMSKREKEREGIEGYYKDKRVTIKLGKFAKK